MTHTTDERNQAIANANMYRHTGNVFRSIGMEDEAQYEYRLADAELRRVGLEG